MSEGTLTSKNFGELALCTAAESTPGFAALSVDPLANGQESEVLSFLAERPLHTVVMAGYLRDNGVQGSFNRGQFYGCRNREGQLEGVALIGHLTLVETRTEASLLAFARRAQSCPHIHMIIGEQEKIERFWKYYARAGEAPRRICRELLFEQRWPVEAREPVPDLRLATLGDLQEVMQVQGQMAFAESGVNPSQVDPEGFRRRCARRIEQGRVWIWTEDGRLIFKADVISDTPHVIYLEGIYVDPLDRGRGFGTRCMSQLSQRLLTRTGALCIFVNEQSNRAQSFFQQAGFKLRSYYVTIFPKQKGYHQPTH